MPRSRVSSPSLTTIKYSALSVGQARWIVREILRDRDARCPGCAVTISQSKRSGVSRESLSFGSCKALQDGFCGGSSGACPNAGVGSIRNAARGESTHGRRFYCSSSDSTKHERYLCRGDKWTAVDKIDALMHANAAL